MHLSEPSGPIVRAEVVTGRIVTNSQRFQILVNAFRNLVGKLALYDWGAFLLPVCYCDLKMRKCMNR